MEAPAPAPPLALVTGATGYIGGRLVPELLDAGFRVRCVARNPDRLRDHPWADRVEVVRADVSRPESLGPAFDGVDTAFYLIHSLGSGPDFERTEERTARAFADASRAAGVRPHRLPGRPGSASVRPDRLSPHLRSRLRVGKVLRESAVPTVELRAALVIGSGSASFEMLRYLTERLPVMLTPRWVDTAVQPIAVRDVLRYLVGAAAAPDEAVDPGRVFDIGGPDVLTYRAMMQRYARIAELRAADLPLPVRPTPALSSQWIGAVTPVPASIARPLVESLRQESSAATTQSPGSSRTRRPGCSGSTRRSVWPWRGSRRPTSPRAGPRRASPAPRAIRCPPTPSGPAASCIRTRVRSRSRRRPSTCWQAVEAIGGETGWYSFPLAWVVRGWLDRAAGGIGLRRGRRDPRTLRLGESLDWWRVEALERGRLLRLRAEMKMPGLGWFEMRVDPGARGGTLYRQRAVFYPRGLFGHLYWWSMTPFHAVLYRGMARNLANAAHQAAGTGADG